MHWDIEISKLTRREKEIAEQLAWGRAKKEIADILFIAEDTVENHTRNIYSKIGCQKATELSAWWFCTRYSISLDQNPIAKRIVTFLLFMIVSISAVQHYDYQFMRTSRTQSQVRVRTRKESTLILEF